jgi:hypothetical protein
MTRRRNDLPQGLEETVSSELRRLAATRPVGSELGELVARWPEAVGPAIARNAWPARIAKDGSLVVHAATSTWAAELTHLAGEIRPRLGTAAPPSLRFVVGPLPEPDTPAAPSVSQPVHTPSSEDRRTAREMAQPIEDPALREAVAEAISRSLARGRGRAPDRPV